jgi:DNA-binding PadR family transcriptional regulator
LYELLVLSLLMHFPLHAYLIADTANDILGPWEHISRGNLSSLLKKLEQAGYIAPADPAQVPFPTTRAARVFAITPAGRDRFYRLMLDTTSNQGTYQRLFHIKILHLEFLSRQDQLYLVEHYLTYCQTTLRYLHTEALDMATDPVKQEHVSSAMRRGALDLMELQAHQWELEEAWAQRLRQQILEAETTKETPP